MASVWLSASPVLAGAGFAAIALCYRYGQNRGVLPSHILFLVGVVGVVWLLPSAAAGPWSTMPPALSLLAVLSGLGQALCTRLILPALKRGPLSPLWCAISLAFLPMILYAAWFGQRAIQPLQYLAIATGVACVAVAAMRRQPAGAGVSGRSAGSWDAMVYGGILLALLLLNAFPGFGYEEINRASRPGPLRDVLSAKFLVIMYGCMSAGIAADFLLTGQGRAPLKLALLLGGISAVGSLTGMQCNAYACEQTSSGIVFTVSGISAILMVAVISVLALGEKRDVYWYGSVVLGLATVLLGNM